MVDALKTNKQPVLAKKLSKAIDDPTFALSLDDLDDIDNFILTKINTNPHMGPYGLVKKLDQGIDVSGVTAIKKAKGVPAKIAPSVELTATQADILDVLDSFTIEGGKATIADIVHQTGKAKKTVLAEMGKLKKKYGYQYTTKKGVVTVLDKAVWFALLKLEEPPELIAPHSCFFDDDEFDFEKDVPEEEFEDVSDSMR